MLDPRSLAEKRDVIEESLRRRGSRADLAGAIAAYERNAAAQTQLNDANRRRNEHQESGKRKLSPEEREAHTAKGRQLKDEVAALEAAAAAARAALDEKLLALPNLVHPEVPAGGEQDFRELRQVGRPRAFDFAPKDHLALAGVLDLLDFEAGARVTGQKFYFLKREAALLELALTRFAVDRAAAAGFTPYLTPDLAKRSVVDGLAFSPRGPETQIYSVAGTDLDLIGTAEITLGGLYADSILEAEQLPIRMCGVSHCFRTEAGAAGRESKGLYRVHQFTKIELFALTLPEASEAMHAEILALEEGIYSELELPYRVIDVAAGDLGSPAYRKFDIEAWIPGRGEKGDWGEVTSTSNCTDYQARRLAIRFKQKQPKRSGFAHTLNGTAIAVPRVLIALLENHQQRDGSVRIPATLAAYAGFERIAARG
jgi:seryl-tRNA synthetase